MGITKKGYLLLACVAAIIVAIFNFANPFGDDEPKAEASKQSPVKVYPELGNVDAIDAENGVLSCGKTDGLKTDPVKMPDSGGTVSYNGTLLSATYSASSVVVTVDGPSRFVSGFVVGDNGKMVPFDVPQEATGSKGPGIRLDTVDFKALLDSGVADVWICSL